MRGAVTSHDGYVLLREDRSTHAQNWAFRRGAFAFSKSTCSHVLLLLGKKKLKGVPMVVSVATAKVEGRRRSCMGAEGCPFDPFDATDELPGCSPSQAAIRRTMIVFNHQFGKFLHSCCVDSQTSVTCQASHQRKEPLLTEIDVNVCEVRPPPAMHDCHGRRSRQKTRRCRSSVTKKHRRYSRRKSSINIVQWGVVRLVVVVKGEWSRRVALHEACMGVQVHTGTRIHWDAHQTFFVRKSGEGGGGPSKFFGNTDLKKLRKLRTTP